MKRSDPAIHSIRTKPHTRHIFHRGSGSSDANVLLEERKSPTTLTSPEPAQNRGDASLSNKSAGGGALVTPGGGQDTDGLVVAGETVDTGLDENETELGVLVLAVTLEVLADGDGLVH